jgi:hypothetical protein
MSDQRVYQGGAHQYEGILAGDTYPSLFNYQDPALDSDLFTLWVRNEFVQLMIDWMPFEAFRRGVQFIEDEGEIQGFKFGKEYTFKGFAYQDKNSGKTVELTGFEEYYQWNRCPGEWVFGVGMSRLYPEGALLVFLDDVKNLLPLHDKAGKAYIPWPANPNPQGYFSFKAYQPIEVGKGTGFCVHKCDEDGKVKTWKLQVSSPNMRKAKTFIIDADRCIHLTWKKKENSWCGSSRVLGMARVAQNEEQTFKKLTKRAHDIAGGILEFTGIASETEQTAIDNDLGSDLTSVDRVYLQEGRTCEYKTPDLKAAGEFASLFEMYSKKLCRHMRVSQLILDGEHTGAGLGGNNNVELMNSFSEIYQIQEHYRSDLEHVFYKLGKTNTTFIYNEILPEEMTPEDDAVGEDSDGQEDHDGKDGGSDTRKESPDTANNKRD